MKAEFGFEPITMMEIGSGIKAGLAKVGGMFSQSSQRRKMKTAIAEREKQRAMQPKPDYIKYAMFGIPAVFLLLLLKGKKKDEPRFFYPPRY